MQETINDQTVIFAVTVKDIRTVLSRRMSELSAEELQMAVAEVKSVLEDQLEIRDYIEMGLDNWEIVRKL